MRETRITHAAATATVRQWVDSGTRVCITFEVSGVVLVHACGVLNKPVRWDPDEDDLLLGAIVGQEREYELDYRRSFHSMAPGRYALGHATTFGTGVAFYYSPTRSRIKRTLRLGPKVRVIMFPLEKGEWDKERGL